jgi:hypothetical protein
VELITDKGQVFTFIDPFMFDSFMGKQIGTIERSFITKHLLPLRFYQLFIQLTTIIVQGSRNYGERGYRSFQVRFSQPCSSILRQVVRNFARHFQSSQSFHRSRYRKLGSKLIFKADREKSSRKLKSFFTIITQICIGQVEQLDSWQAQSIRDCQRARFVFSSLAENGKVSEITTRFAVHFCACKIGNSLLQRQK